MDAQVPNDARVSLNEAADTNPTENKVFDVVLLLEQITAEFGTFRQNVKDAIYDLLTWQAGFWEVTKFAEVVWNFVDNRGLSTVEKIINWFDTEERHEVIAKIILNDDTLKDNLNYGVEGETLNYAAVAKVGLLVFADHIHKTWIESTTWIKNTWEWLFGTSYTLMNLVYDALGGLAATIGAIKTAAESAWEGIKAAGQFIANTVLGAILDLILSGANNIVKFAGYLFEEIIPGVTFSESGNGFLLNNEFIEFSRSNLILSINFGEIYFDVSNLFSGPDIGGNIYDTLSISGVDQLENFGIMLGLSVLQLGITAAGLGVDIAMGANPLAEWTVFSLVTVGLMAIYAVLVGLVIHNILNPSWGSYEQRLDLKIQMQNLFLSNTIFSVLSMIAGGLIGFAEHKGWTLFLEANKELISYSTFATAALFDMIIAFTQEAVMGVLLAFVVQGADYALGRLMSPVKYVTLKFYMAVLNFVHYVIVKNLNVPET